MIKNDRQYRITKAQADKFERALTELIDRSHGGRQVHPLLKKAEEEALRSQLADLRVQIEEFEALRSGKCKIPKIGSFEELPRVLIRARIGSGLSQKDLAERLQ